MVPSDVMKGIISEYISKKKKLAHPINLDLEKQAVPKNKRLTSAFLVHDIALYYSNEINTNPKLWRGIMLMVSGEVGFEYSKRLANYIWQQNPKKSALYTLYVQAINYHAQEEYEGETVFDESFEFECMDLADTFLGKLKFNDRRFVNYKQFIGELQKNIFTEEAQQTGLG